MGVVQMPTVQIGGDASGAIAAVAAAQAAIDGMTGKTVRVHVETSGTGAAMADMAKMGESAEKAGKSSRNMSDDLGRSSGHVSNMAKDAEKLAKDMERAARGGGRGGAQETARQAEALRRMGIDADNARKSMGELGGGSRSLGEIGSRADNAGRGMRELGSGSASAHQFMVGAGGSAARVSRELTTLGGGASGAGRGMRELTQGADGVYRSVSKLGGAAGEVERFSGAMRTIDAVGRTIDGGGSGGGGGLGRLLGKLGDLPGVATPSMGALRGVGLAAGVSALGMGALTAAVAGVGLAGVAEDFMHNSQLMHSGEQAVRGFNREFSAMKGATTAAGSSGMAAVASSMKGVGHELAQLGAANIAPVLNDVASLGNQATGAMQKLAPSIGPATQGLTALAGAVLGAFGDSGPAVTGFANTVTQNAAGLQSLMSGVISTAATIGNATVSTAANLPGGMDQAAGGSSLGEWTNKAAQWVGDQGRSFLGGKSFSPLSAMPTGHDMMGNPTTPAPGGAASAARPGAFDPSKPFSGMLPDGKGGFTVGTADDSKPKGASASSHDGDWAKGMTGAQILTAERARVGLPAVGQPHYGGMGAPPPGLGEPLPGAAPPASERGGAPRPVAGFGSGARPMPSSVATGLGMGDGGLGSLMTGGLQSQVAGGGAATGTSMVQHIQKAVSVAAPAAAAGGAAIGAGVNTGMAQGSNSTQSVIDTVTIKHSKRIIDLAKDALGIHSPSTEFDYLGRMTWAGFGRGQERESEGTFGAMSASMSKMLSGQRYMAERNSPDYDGAPGVTVSVPRPKKAMDYTSSLANKNIDAHNKRASELAAGREDLQRQAIGGMTHDERRDMLLRNRANNHERALANLGVGGRSKPSGDVNPFAADQANAANRRAGIAAVVNPFHNIGLKAAGAEHGQAMAAGVTVGLGKGTPGAQAGVSAFSKAVQGQHKKDHGIASPATVWISDGFNLAAGAAGGVTAGTPMAVASVNTMSGQMQQAGQWLSDKGLMVGYAWAQNVVTGAQQEIKKADYQTLGLPQLASQAAMLSLASTQLLSAGSGAQGYKTPGNAPGLVTLGDAVPAQQEVTVHAHFHLDGQITTISQQAMVNVLEQAGHSIELQASG